MLAVDAVCHPRVPSRAGGCARREAAPPHLRRLAPRRAHLRLHPRGGATLGQTTWALICPGCSSLLLDLACRSEPSIADGVTVAARQQREHSGNGVALHCWCRLKLCWRAQELSPCRLWCTAAQQHGRCNWNGPRGPPAAQGGQAFGCGAASERVTGESEKHVRYACVPEYMYGRYGRDGNAYMC